MNITLNGNTTTLAVNRHLGMAKSYLNTTMERLSTGLRINKASDDAANLNLTKSVDSHISNARIFQDNAQNAMNLLDIAEGDMAEMQESLQRLRELAIQGLNDVYSASELAAIKQEVDELALGIEQIAKSSSFSDKKLLDGSTNDVVIQVSDDFNISTSNINLNPILEELDFVDVLTEKEQLYFLNMVPGGTYYAEFDDRLYEITNSSTEPRSLIYRYEENLGDLDRSIEFIQGNDGVSASLYGEYENDHVQLGSGEMVVDVAAGDTAHVRVGNRVFDLTNSSGTSNSVVFETAGSTINILSGDGIAGSYEYDTSAYTNLSLGDYALDFAAGETKHVEFAGRLYELQNTSASSQTFVYDNSGGLSSVVGGASINITDMGAMTNEVVMSGTEKYVELTAGQAEYFEDGGNIYRLQNTTGDAQSVILDAANNVLNTTGTVSRTLMSSAANGDVSAMTNPYAMQVQSGQTYYIKSADNTTLHELTATQSGVALIDFDGDNIVGFDGANLTHNIITGTSFSDVTPDGANRFTINLSANSQEYVTIGNEVYELDNSGHGPQSVEYRYNSAAQTVTDISGGGTNGTFIDILDTPNSIGANDIFVENLAAGATTYIEVGSDIFEITNTGGAAQGFTFDYNAGAHTLTPTIAGSVTATAMDLATTNSVDAGDIMLNLNAGQTQHITVAGNTFDVQNTLGSAQTVLLSENSGNLNIDSGSALNITKYTDMDAGTALNGGNFYVDLNAGQTKYISRGGELFEVQNTTGDSKIAVFSQTGATLNNIETSNVNASSMGAETAEYVTNASDYYIELNSNEQKWVNINGAAFELNNNVGVNQTEVLRTTGSTITNEINPNVNQMNIPISNLDDYNQLLIKVDWAMKTLQERRTELGSKMHALEASIFRSSNREINLLASNSLLRDADIAKESVDLTKNQILQKTASAMFSQAKNINRDVSLVLLSGF